MTEVFNPVRYSIIDSSPKREIVMLMGDGCKWRKCSFCDYHLDSSKDKSKNFAVNKEALSKVTGQYGELEVINSGSFVDLDENTMELIENICQEKHIHTLHFECHWIHRDKVKEFKKKWENLGIKTYIRLGLETFDKNFREEVLKKGIEENDPVVIASYFDEINLLQGISGQTAESMCQDIRQGLKYFDRVYVNIMTENSTPVKPNQSVIKVFKESVYPIFCEDSRVDILMENTDFGVGGDENE